MDDLEKLYEILLPERENIYSHLNMEYVTHADYTHTKRFWNKTLDKYHDLHFQSKTLFVGDVFENFQSMCLEIYELDTTCFLTAPGLS